MGCCDAFLWIIQAYLLQTLPKKLGLLARDAAARRFGRFAASRTGDFVLLLLWVQAALVVEGKEKALRANFAMLSGRAAVLLGHACSEVGCSGVFDRANGWLAGAESFVSGTLVQW